MNSIKLTTAVLLFLSHCGWTQTPEDKSQIYKAVIERFADKTLPIINETITRIYNCDIDGNYQKWFYQQSSQRLSDTSMLVGTSICVIPVKYSQSVTHFLDSMAILSDPTFFLNQTSETKFDSLSRYISEQRLISWRKAPLAYSAVGNLFKKKRVVGLSQILFDTKNNLAVIKYQVYSKKKLPKENPSKLVILRKTDSAWTIIGSLDEKQQPTLGLALYGRKEDLPGS